MGVVPRELVADFRRAVDSYFVAIVQRLPNEPKLFNSIGGLRKFFSTRPDRQFRRVSTLDLGGWAANRNQSGISDLPISTK